MAANAPIIVKMAKNANSNLSQFFLNNIDDESLGFVDERLYKYREGLSDGYVARSGNRGATTVVSEKDIKRELPKAFSLSINFCRINEDNKLVADEYDRMSSLLLKYYSLGMTTEGRVNANSGSYSDTGTSYAANRGVFSGNEEPEANPGKPKTVNIESIETFTDEDAKELYGLMLVFSNFTRNKEKGELTKRYEITSPEDFKEIEHSLDSYRAAEEPHKKREPMIKSAKVVANSSELPSFDIDSFRTKLVRRVGQSRRVGFFGRSEFCTKIINGEVSDLQSIKEHADKIQNRAGLVREVLYSNFDISQQNTNQLTVSHK